MNFKRLVLSLLLVPVSSWTVAPLGGRLFDIFHQGCQNAYRHLLVPSLPNIQQYQIRGEAQRLLALRGHGNVEIVGINSMDRGSYGRGIAALAESLRRDAYMIPHSPRINKIFFYDRLESYGDFEEVSAFRTGYLGIDLSIFSYTNPNHLVARVTGAMKEYELKYGFGRHGPSSLHISRWDSVGWRFFALFLGTLYRALDSARDSVFIPDILKLRIVHGRRIRIEKAILRADGYFDIAIAVGIDASPEGLGIRLSRALSKAKTIAKESGLLVRQRAE